MAPDPPSIPPPIEVVPIGRVACDERDALNDVARLDWSRVRSAIVLDEAAHPGIAEALLGLEDYSHVIVVAWLDRIPEDLRARRRAYPGGDDRLPLQGSLALRGGARPNPIAVTVARLLAIDITGEGATLRVEGLDLVDGTPILDVKPYIAHYDAVPKATIPKWASG